VVPLDFLYSSLFMPRFGLISGMNLIDILEMACDWKAASLRHANGNFSRSVELCSERFGISAQLSQIILNTASLFEVRNV
jgi:hypothetical protein